MCVFFIEFNKIIVVHRFEKLKTEPNYVFIPNFKLGNEKDNRLALIDNYLSTHLSNQIVTLSHAQDQELQKV